MSSFFGRGVMVCMRADCQVSLHGEVVSRSCLTQACRVASEGVPVWFEAILDFVDNIWLLAFCLSALSDTLLDCLAVDAHVFSLEVTGQSKPLPALRCSFDGAKPSAPLESGNNLRLQISDAVLCSEMGVHFSPCGRYLAATTACRTPLPPAVTPTGPAAMVLGASAGDVAAAEREALAAMLVSVEEKMLVLDW